MESFKTQIAALTPIALRALARWQRTMLARRNPAVAPTVRSLSDEQIAEGYFRVGFAEIEQIQAETARRVEQALYADALHVVTVSCPTMPTRAAKYYYASGGMV